MIVRKKVRCHNNAIFLLFYFATVKVLTAEKSLEVWCDSCEKRTV